MLVTSPAAAASDSSDILQYGDARPRACARVSEPEDATNPTQPTQVELFGSSVTLGRPPEPEPEKRQLPAPQRPCRPAITPSEEQASFALAYAITAHKSQGSERQRVLIYDDFGIDAERSRWLYTAITRASAAVRIVRMGREPSGDRDWQGPSDRRLEPIGENLKGGAANKTLGAKERRTGTLDEPPSFWAPLSLVPSGRCKCCRGGRWWTSMQADRSMPDLRAWRCVTCHPPLIGAAIIEYPSAANAIGAVDQARSAA